MSRYALTAVAPVKPGAMARLKNALAVLRSRPPDQAPVARVGTVHFARWVILHETHLMFVSEFDGDWEVYLDTFIDEAWQSLDAVFGNCVGYPPGGARDRDAFKAYVRMHECPAEATYAAYPDASVEEIGRALRVRRALRPAVREIAPDLL